MFKTDILDVAQNLITIPIKNRDGTEIKYRFGISVIDPSASDLVENGT